ncbi:MAG: FHA domain-containing protein [Actinomycetes bacterium]
MSEPATGSPPASWTGWARVRVHPGSGVVDCRGDSLLVVPAAAASQHELVQELLRLCRRAEPAGHGRLRAARAMVESSDAAEVPDFALLVRVGGAVRALFTPAVRLLVDGGAAERSEPADARVAEQVLEDDAWQAVVVGSRDAPSADVPAALDPSLPLDTSLASDPGLPLDLETGTVPGAAVTLVRVPAERVPAQPPAADSAVPPREPVETGMTTLRPALQFRSLLLGECARTSDDAHRPHGRRRPPLPVAGDTGRRPAHGGAGKPSDVLVDGVLCSRGHFNDPDLPTCVSCGTPIPADQARVRMPRPPLGILVTDGGTIYTVTGNYVIGREADRSPEVLGGHASSLPLRDAARSTSRIHARLTVSGWKVLLTDARSANGTFLSRNGASGPWRRLPPEVPVALAHGDRLRLGKRQLLFDSWREPVPPEAVR